MTSDNPGDAECGRTRRLVLSGGRLPLSNLVSPTAAAGTQRVIAIMHQGNDGVSSTALRGGMHDREEDIEKFTAKQLELLELECAAEETATQEEQQSLTMKQLEVRT